jgi:site-specific DNA-methyltransferase (adenine-specific)
MNHWHIAHQDAAEWLLEQPDNSIDLLFTDPPYNTTQLPYEKSWVWCEATFKFWWNQVKRITKPHAWVVMFAANPFGAKLICSNETAFRFSYTWVKSRKTNPQSSGWRPLGQHEDIHVFCMGKVTLAPYNPQLADAEVLRSGRGLATGGSAWDDEYEFDPWVDDGTRLPVTALYCPSPKRVQGSHPSQKPVELLEYVIRTHSNVGDVVGDAFVGSGSSGVASAKQGRCYVGCEKDKHWHGEASRDVGWQYAQTPLFAGGA